VRRRQLLGAMLALVAIGGNSRLLAQGAVQRPPDSVGRARLENEIRRVFARAVRQRVGLNEAQMSRLGPVAQQYEQQRRRLQMEERDTRLSLRASLRNEQAADSKQVDSMLQRMVAIQRRRLDLLESEQRDLATFMTPLQRAKYAALQEQFRRRVEQMRQRRTQLLEGDPAAEPGPARRPNRRSP
jgi:periplasmic protein CpxP/Spy